MRTLRFCFLVITVLLAGGAGAADEDGGLWATASLSKKLDGNFSAAVALQLRFFDDINTLERTLLRPSVSYRIDPRQLVTLGYDAHFIDAPSNKVEQRLWQQYQISQAFTALSATLRIRLEERFIDHVDEVPVRIRLKGSLKMPLPQSPWFFTLANEGFISFNDVRGGQRDGFHENRAFAGFGRPLGEGLVGQIGYQNQFIEGAARDRIIHQMFIGLSVKIP